MGAKRESGQYRWMLSRLRKTVSSGRAVDQKGERVQCSVCVLYGVKLIKKMGLFGRLLGPEMHQCSSQSWRLRVDASPAEED
jgi:hypothetical protein